jgi:hypothetical protein
MKSITKRIKLDRSKLFGFSQVRPGQTGSNENAPKAAVGMKTVGSKTVGIKTVGIKTTGLKTGAAA